MEYNERNNVSNTTSLHEEMVDSARIAFQARYPTSSRITSPEFTFALTFAKSLAFEQPDSSSNTAQILQAMKESGQEYLPDITMNSKPAAEKPEVNWGTYQRMGGDPAMWELFPLDDVPFKPQEYYMHKGKHEGASPAINISVSVNWQSHAEAAPVKYCPQDPKLIGMLLDAEKVINRSKANDNHEDAAGFCENDDRTFFTGEPLSPRKDGHSITTHFGPSDNAAPFTGFHSQQQQGRGNHRGGFRGNPRHQYGARGNTNHGMKKENPDLGDIYSNLAAMPMADPYQKVYGMTGNPLNTGSNAYQTSNIYQSSARAPNSNLPQRSRFFPAQAAATGTEVHSPSPARIANPLNQEASRPNHFSSFSAFNTSMANQNQEAQQHAQHAQQAFYSTPSQTQASQVPTQYYNASPTKTRAQISRAFNSPASKMFSGAGAMASNIPATQDFSANNWTYKAPENPQFFRTQIQATRNMQTQVNRPASNSITATNQTPSTSGAAAYYAGTGTARADSPGTFTTGAGLSRAFNSGSNSASSSPTRTPVGRLGAQVPIITSLRRVAQSQLRADSPAFQSTQANNRNQAISTYLREVSDGLEEHAGQMGSGTENSTPSNVGSGVIGSSPAGNFQDTPTKMGAEKESRMGFD